MNFSATVRDAFLLDGNAMARMTVAITAMRLNVVQEVNKVRECLNLDISCT